MPRKTIKFTTRILPLKHLKMNYLEVPSSIVSKIGGITKRRWLCTVNTLTWQCGLVALGNGNAYISLNKKIMKELGLTTGQKIKVILEADTSQYGMEMSTELKTLLKQDKEGSRRFQLLPAGKRRYIIYYVSQVKASQLRIDRAIRLIENLKGTSVGKESFREILSK
jgi:Domain of unknown function (DUF1905)/Bacteriocin-protection, YdeI or OmpD-Associated